MTETTTDAFLNGRLQIIQPRNGYRAGADPVFLAAAVPASPGQRILELGTGVATALLCLMSRVPDLECVGVELQPDLADMARENARRNGFEAEIVTADLTDLPGGLRARSFEHVLMNPPFFERGKGTPPNEPGRRAGRAEETALSDWVDAAARRLAPGGWLTMIQRIERLPEALGACDGRLGSLQAAPLAGRAGRETHLVLLSGRKGGKAPFRLRPPFVLHKGAAHDRDRDSYTPEASAILRHGAAFPLGN